MNINLPLLSDRDSAVIRAFGILNDNVPAGTPFHGVPFPGTYIVNPDGVVQSKFFEDDYRERFTAGAILERVYNVAGTTRTEIETKHLKLANWASNQTVFGGSRVRLTLEIDLPKGMHVYAPGVQSSYIPIDWKIPESKAWLAFDAIYPKPRTLHLPAIKESAPVFEGKFRLERDLTIAQANELTSLLTSGNNLTVEAAFRYQACDDKLCYTPQTVPLKWTFTVQQSDRQRVPTELRKVN
ncbi:MAG: redoxin domain-containing protein [Acidimicrobiia bacterium]|nr:redoxin domain-containing protein [Acidimicrobiia bacterium]